MKTSNRFRVIIASKGKTKSIDIDKDTCVLGRASNCDITIDDELISRQHLRISLIGKEIFIEELGSSNGSWLNGERLVLKKKTLYSFGSFLNLGGANGISLSIEDLSSIQQAPVAKASSEPEKTLVYNLAQSEFLKVANGSVSVSSPSPASSSPAPKKARPEKIMKLVEQDTLADLEPTVQIKHSNTSTHKIADSKKSFEDQVKMLVNIESENLRASSLKEAALIRQKAIDEKNEIVAHAQTNAKKLIDDAKKEGAKIVKNAELSIVSINEQIKMKEEASAKTLQELNSTISQNEEKIKLLKHEEGTHLQRIKALKEDFSTIKERIKNESALIEDLKQQVATHRKNSELKLEEYALEERRVKAKIETEIIEARSQVARILAEAEKSQIQKEMLEPEIHQLKSDKDRLEREINEFQISYRRFEYDIERITTEHDEAQAKTHQAVLDLQTITQELTEQKHKHAQIEENISIKENEINEKIRDIHIVTDKMIEEARLQSQAIVKEANTNAELINKKRAEAIKELETHKVKFHADLSKEKEEKFKALDEEVEATRAKLKIDLDKLEHKKSNVINEIKWLEDNAKKKCDMLLEKTRIDIEAGHKMAMLENDKIKLKATEEINLQRKNADSENQKLKQATMQDIQILRSEAQEHCLKMKQKMQNSINEAQVEIQQEKNLIAALTRENEIILKRHREALEKTESLMDENYLQAEQKIKAMLESARLNAAELERSSREQNAMELAKMTEYKRIELNKIEDAKAEIDGYNIISLQNTAASIAETIEDFLGREMMKSKNFMIDEKIINKTSKKVNQMVTDLLLGRYETPNIVIPAQPIPKQKRKVKKIFIFAALGLIIYAIAHFNPELVKLTIETTKDVLKTQKITIFDDAYAWLVNFLK